MIIHSLMHRIHSLPVLLLLFLVHPVNPQDNQARIIQSYTVPESRQGVAVDAAHFYVINNHSITKHEKSDGRLVDSWEDKDSLIHHLNSGIVIDGMLYTIHSNYPESPMASSIEIFDPRTLEHIGNHSFGILNGSATWMAEYKGYWYVAFAHYSGTASEPGKTNAWTRLVRFDKEWRQLESWIYPAALVKKFKSMSNSGGVILPDGRIICTGHDYYELYVLAFPTKGYSLIWTGTIPVGSFGQGIAYEKKGDAELIYGIIKKEGRVVVSRID